MVRIVVVLLTLLALPRAADACCLGCPCTKYQRQPPVVVELMAQSYSHSVRGALPAFRIERIAAFLAKGTWIPVKPPPGAPAPARDQPLEPGVPMREYRDPVPLLFRAPDKAVPRPGKVRTRTVLIRRIEKSGTAILVEVDDRTYTLGACPRKRGYICLMAGGELAPIPAPGSGFAQPPGP